MISAVPGARGSPYCGPQGGGAHSRGGQGTGSITLLNSFIATDHLHKHHILRWHALQSTIDLTRNGHGLHAILNTSPCILDRWDLTQCARSVVISELGMALKVPPSLSNDDHCGVSVLLSSVPSARGCQHPSSTPYRSMAADSKLCPEQHIHCTSNNTYIR